MTTNDDPDRALEARVRSWMREEIVAAFKVMGRAADHENDYETQELDSRALDNIERVAEGAVRRLTCEHPSYSTWGDPHTCSRCGEPEPEPVNPFETPLDPGCNHAFAKDDDGTTTCQLCDGVKTNAR